MTLTEVIALLHDRIEGGTNVSFDELPGIMDACAAALAVPVEPAEPGSDMGGHPTPGGLSDVPPVEPAAA
jgi:hypothetical protein